MIRGVPGVPLKFLDLRGSTEILKGSTELVYWGVIGVVCYVSLSIFQSRVSEPLLWIGSQLPFINPYLMSFLYNILRIFTPYERVGISHEVAVPTVYVPPNYQVCMFVHV